MLEIWWREDFVRVRWSLETWARPNPGLWMRFMNDQREEFGDGMGSDGGHSGRLLGQSSPFGETPHQDLAINW